MLMSKTPKGTINGQRWENGVLLGIYGKDNFVSLEYNNIEDRIELLIRAEELKELGVEIKYVDKEWQEKTNE